MSFFRQIFPVFPKFWENRDFPGHAIFTQMWPLLASNCMMKTRRILRAKLEKIGKPIFQEILDPIFGPDFRGEGAEISKI